MQHNKITNNKYKNTYLSDKSFNIDYLQELDLLSEGELGLFHLENLIKEIKIRIETCRSCSSTLGPNIMVIHFFTIYFIFFVNAATLY